MNKTLTAKEKPVSVTTVRICCPKRQGQRTQYQYGVFTKERGFDNWYHIPPFKNKGKVVSSYRFSFLGKHSMTYDHAINSEWEIVYRMEIDKSIIRNINKYRKERYDSGKNVDFNEAMLYINNNRSGKGACKINFFVNTDLGK